MEDSDLRLEALRLAVDAGATGPQVMDLATQFYLFMVAERRGVVTTMRTVASQASAEQPRTSQWANLPSQAQTGGTIEAR